MTQLPSTPSTLSAHSIPIPRDVDAFSFLFSSHFKHIPNPNTKDHPHHTFDGRDVPPSRPTLVNAATGAILGRQRLLEDSLKVAVGIRDILGPRVEWDQRAKVGRAVHSPRTTVMIHLPNCIPFGPILLGALRVHATVCPISSLLSPAEVAYVIAKARPRILFTEREGKGRIIAAIEILREKARNSNPFQDFGISGGGRQETLVKQWIQEWDEDFQGLKKRLWTVDLGVDYYGSTVKDLQKDDWTWLLDHSLTEAALAKLPLAKMDPREQMERVALLLWSSGTTGLPKGVLLSHRAILMACVSAWMRPHEVGPWRDGGERWIALAPWCHIFGLSTFFFTGIAQGATMILPPPGRFDLKVFLELMSTHRATWANIAPPVVVALRNTPLLDPSSSQYLSNLDLSSLKGFMSGGAPVAPDVIVDVWKRMGKYVHIGYGASETVGTHQSQAMNLPDAIGQFSELGSTGVLLVNTSARVRPADSLSCEEKEKLHREFIEVSEIKRKRGEVAPVAPCVPGEVQIKSEALMLGYASGFGTDEKTEEGEPCSAVDDKLGGFTEDGWYRSGDEGVLDSSGNLWITGRTKETFKVKGFQVAPPELDALFIKHPAIADAAAGSHHETQQGTDVVILYVQPRDSSILKGKDAAQKQIQLVNELDEWVRPLVSYYKWPRYYVFTAAIPKSPSGKILRKDLHKLPEQRHPAPKNPHPNAKL